MSNSIVFLENYVESELPCLSGLYIQAWDVPFRRVIDIFGPNIECLHA